MITRYLYCCLLLAVSCTLPEEKRVADETALLRDTTIRNADSNTALQADTIEEEPLRLPPPIKNPNGIYQAHLPLTQPLMQTIVFNKDFTYRLQESYTSEGKDSAVETRGTWTPSDGFIWLYKDQVVRARYRWKEDTLQYYSPLLKKSFSMQSVVEIQEKATDALVTGGGTEPFWSIEVMSKDSLRFHLPEWEQPLSLHISAVQSTKDSTTYVAGNETEQLRFTLLPFFCSDGMSDLVYPQKVRVTLGSKFYTGCGRIRKL